MHLIIELNTLVLWHISIMRIENKLLQSSMGQCREDDYIGEQFNFSVQREDIEVRVYMSFISLYVGAVG